MEADCIKAQTLHKIIRAALEKSADTGYTRTAMDAIAPR